MNKTRIKFILRVLLALLFIAAGVLHFTRTSFYLEIMPSFLPFQLALVHLSGILEIILGIGLLIPALERYAGYGLIALLIAVFPANIHMAINDVPVGGVVYSPLLLWLRLPLQFALIALVWWCTTRTSAPDSARQLQG